MYEILGETELAAKDRTSYKAICERWNVTEEDLESCDKTIQDEQVDRLLAMLGEDFLMNLNNNNNIEEDDLWQNY